MDPDAVDALEPCGLHTILAVGEVVVLRHQSDSGNITRGLHPRCDTVFVLFLQALRALHSTRLLLGRYESGGYRICFAGVWNSAHARCGWDCWMALAVSDRGKLYCQYSGHYER